MDAAVGPLVGQVHLESPAVTVGWAGSAEPGAAPTADTLRLGGNVPRVECCRRDVGEFTWRQTRAVFRLPWTMRRCERDHRGTPIRMPVRRRSRPSPSFADHVRSNEPLSPGGRGTRSVNQTVAGCCLTSSTVEAVTFASPQEARRVTSLPRVQRIARRAECCRGSVTEQVHAADTHAWPGMLSRLDWPQTCLHRWRSSSSAAANRRTRASSPTTISIRTASSPCMPWLHRMRRFDTRSCSSMSRQPAISAPTGTAKRREHPWPSPPTPTPPVTDRGGAHRTVRGAVRRPLRTTPRSVLNIALHPDEFAELWIDEDRQLGASEAALANGAITIEERLAIDLAIVEIAATNPNVVATASRPTSTSASIPWPSTTPLAARGFIKCTDAATRRRTATSRGCNTKPGGHCHGWTCDRLPTRSPPRPRPRS